MTDSNHGFHVSVRLSTVLTLLAVILLGACAERDLKRWYSSPHTLRIDSKFYEYTDQTGAETVGVALRNLALGHGLLGGETPSNRFLLTFVRPRWQPSAEADKNSLAELGSIYGMNSWRIAFFPSGQSRYDWDQKAVIEAPYYYPVSGLSPIDELRQAANFADCADGLERVSVKALGNKRWLGEFVCGRKIGGLFDLGKAASGYYTIQYLEISDDVAVSFYHMVEGTVFDPDDQSQWPGSPEFRKQIIQLMSQTKLTATRDFNDVEDAKYEMATNRSGAYRKGNPGYPKAFRLLNFTSRD